jgi:hypothetical protein
MAPMSSPFSCHPIMTPGGAPFSASADEDGDSPEAAATSRKKATAAHQRPKDRIGNVIDHYGATPER